MPICEECTLGYDSTFLDTVIKDDGSVTGRLFSIESTKKPHEQHGGVDVVDVMSIYGIILFLHDVALARELRDGDRGRRLVAFAAPKGKCWEHTVCAAFRCSVTERSNAWSFAAITGVNVSSMRPRNTSVPVVTTPTRRSFRYGRTRTMASPAPHRRKTRRPPSR